MAVTSQADVLIVVLVEIDGGEKGNWTYTIKNGSGVQLATKLKPERSPTKDETASRGIAYLEHRGPYRLLDVF
ncbi:MAG TPA: hypothetical protein VGN72_19820 [Tepidisphaeraceae bacterium]|jgi:hypothetical protein|nr:hypothetical protein [Tepidisphaeraceae bacterium]